jgi:hypothetical protein
MVIVFVEDEVSAPVQVADPELKVIEQNPPVKLRPSSAVSKLVTKEKDSQVKSIPNDGMKVNVNL